MKTRTVKKTSIFPANAHVAFRELQKLSTRRRMENDAIWLWARAFYAHRQRKWIKLLNRGESCAIRG